MRRIVLLRGINLGPRRRVPMAALRALLSEAGYEGVRTYVQSGNVALESAAAPEELESDLVRLLSDRFGFEVPVVSRTAEELAAVVSLNPLGQRAEEPKRYQVSFLDREPSPALIERLRELVIEPEAVALAGREIFAWYPSGVARSKLWNTLAGTRLGVTATARNWTTVLALHEMMKD